MSRHDTNDDRPAGGDPGTRLPLKPVVFQVLLVLLDGERHGYAIVKALEAADGRRLEPGNLYRTLRTMLGDGLIAESARRPDPELDDQRRRYFRVTGFGRAVARAEAVRLERLVLAARARDLLGKTGEAS